MDDSAHPIPFPAVPASKMNFRGLLERGAPEQPAWLFRVRIASAILCVISFIISAASIALAKSGFEYGYYYVGTYGSSLLLAAVWTRQSPGP
jgi:hypothetical protein